MCTTGYSPLGNWTTHPQEESRVSIKWMLGGRHFSTSYHQVLVPSEHHGGHIIGAKRHDLAGGVIHWLPVSEVSDPAAIAQRSMPLAKVGGGQRLPYE